MKKLIDLSTVNIQDIECGFGCTTDLWAVEDWLKKLPTVDAVAVVRIEEVKQEILQQMDMFIAEYDRIGFYGKSDVMDIAKRLVNAVLTDLARMDGERKDE